MPARSSSPTRERLLCPTCRYDVAQTLTDGIATCPECGGGIDAEICRVVPGAVPWRLQNRLNYSCLFVVAGATAWIAAEAQRGEHALWWEIVRELMSISGLCACVVSSIAVEQWIAGGQPEKSKAFVVLKGIGIGFVYWLGHTMLGIVLGWFIGLAIRLIL